MRPKGTYDDIPLGLLPDPEDSRDIIMASFLPRGVHYPPAVDHRPFMTPARDQGAFPACVGFATCAMKEYQEEMEWQREHPQIYSPDMLYAECKKIDGIPNSAGTYIRSAMKVLVDVGVCLEAFWPYRQSPAEGYLKDAARQKIRKYAAIKSREDLCSSLYLNGPCPIGFDITTDWYNPEAGTGLISVPRKNARRLGGHCVCAVGYSPAGIKVKNSWGRGWGLGGYAIVPWEWLENDRHFISCWSATDLLGEDQPKNE